MKVFAQLAVLLAAVTAWPAPSVLAQEESSPAPSKQMPRAETPALPLGAVVPTDPSISRTAQETSAAAVLPPTDEPTGEIAGQNPLEELAWMVGEWVDQDESLTIESAVNWTRNGAFLLRSYMVTGVLDEPHSGMQLIAWDPAEGRIRSWTYDSRGGFGEESWNHVGNRWSLRGTFTLPDGGKGSAIQVITPLGDNAYKWKSVSRVLDGELQPDIDEVTVYRRTAPPAATDAPSDASTTDPAASPTTAPATSDEPPAPAPNTEKQP